MCFGSKRHQNDEGAVQEPVRTRSKVQERPTGFSSIVTRHASGLGMCKGCHDEVCWLLEDWKRQRAATNESMKSKDSQTFINGKVLEPKSKVFHDSFAQLADCAVQCTSCRVFYQALLLRQATKADQERLLHDNRSIVASLMQSGGAKEGDLLPDLLLRISVSHADDNLNNAYVSCSRRQDYDFLQLSRGARNSTVYIKQCLEECRASHMCGELDWSPSNPTRLIEIVDDKSIRLVRGSEHDSRLPYMILSYCWGGVDSGITVTNNLQRRMTAFDTAELPLTLQDAITIARQNGLQHVWIDQLCIQQDDADDWKREATKMHQYYGNALFTLCAAANEHANENVLKDRLAWKWNQLYCELNGWQIAAFDTTLDQARRGSPLSGRGWTLQEEYLSPRIVYWFNHALYWSCAGSQCMENTRAQMRRPVQPEILLSNRPRQPNVFLTACWKGSDKQLLHTEWLGIVESYTRRQLTVANDKFQALSGVAARYFTASQKRNQYLAGLWHETLTLELGYAVKSAGASRQSTSIDKESVIAPSWSWASLPSDVHVNFRQEMQNEKVELATFSAHTDFSADDSADDHVRKGSTVRKLKASGQLGRAWSISSKAVPWAAIERSGDAPGKLTFAQYRDEDAHSADINSGRLAIYRAHTEEILAQLDYIDDAHRIEQGEMQLHYLAITNATVLLLHTTDDHHFKRIGVCYSGRFTEDVDAIDREITLV